MTVEKKITFSAQDNNVGQTYERIRQSAERLGRDLVSSSRAYTTSGKEITQNIEEQIRLIEKRNKLESERLKLGVEKRFEVGMISPEEKRKQLTGVSVSSKEDQLQVQLLRELVDAVKMTAKDEIREDRISVEKQIKSSKRGLSQLGISQDDELSELKQVLQRQYIGDIKEQEVGERERFTYGKVIAGAQRGFGAASGALGAKNEFYALAGLMAAIPFVGGGLSMLSQKALSGAEGLERGMGDVGALEGRGYKGYIGEAGIVRGSYTQLGMTPTEYFNQLATRGRARGSVSAARSEFQGLTDFKIARGLGEDQMTSLSSLYRGGTNERATPLNQLRFIEGFVRDNNMSNELFGDYLQILIDTNKEQVVRLGSLNEDVNNKLVTSITSLNEDFKNPDVLRNVYSGITGGLMTPANPRVEALQFAALRRVNPGASFVDLMTQRERPSAEYLSATLSMLRKMSPTEDILTQNIKGFFPALSWEISKGIGKGDLKIQDYFDPSESVSSEALARKGALQKSSARMDAFFAEKGEKLIQSTEDLMAELDKQFKDMSEFEGKFNKNIANAVERGTRKAMEGIAKSLDKWTTYGARI